MSTLIDRIRDLLYGIEHKKVQEAQKEFHEVKDELVHELEKHGLDQAFKEMEDRLKDAGKSSSRKE